MKLFSLTHVLKELRPLSIDNHRCSRQYSSLNDCQICQDICPTHALAFIDGQWQADGCQNCGLCVAACPMQVFSLEEDALLSAVDKNDSLTLSCRHDVNTPQGQLQISCFGQLYPELIFRLLQQVSQLTLYYNSQTCAQCPNRWQAQNLTLFLEQFHLPLDKLQLIDVSQQSDDHFLPNRRFFLQNIFSQAKTTSKKAVAASAEMLVNQLDPSFTPEIIAKRVPLAMLYRQQKSLDLTKELPYRLLANDACTFCEACSKLCPTEALSLHTDENGEKSLLFQPVLCNQCNICTNVCLSKGLYWSDRLTIGQLLNKTPQTLAKASEQTCTQCDQPFWHYPQDQPICHFCQASQ